MSAPLKRHPKFAAGGEDLFIAVESEAGRVFAAFSDRGVSMVSPAENEDQFRATFARRTGREVRPADSADHGDLVDALTTGDGSLIDCDLEGVSPFTRRVLDATASIERGQTRSYQWLARQIGMPSASRAVGNALGANPLPIIIPCHRIVRGDGSLGGYAFGPDMKQSLLEAEGALSGLTRAV
ncbi:MAG: methylated-DNA--[protein]-cysteine S-methyltransferase [Solirubrobacterales bacterium]